MGEKQQRLKGVTWGPMGVCSHSGNKEESFHQARNLRREPGKRASDLDDQERGVRTGLSLERAGKELCQGKEGGGKEPQERLCTQARSLVLSAWGAAS